MSLTKLKALMRQRNLAYYILPKNDEFMSDTLPISKDRLRKVTGFTGSSGYTIISAAENEKSIFVTDSRYEL